MLFMISRKSPMPLLLHIWMTVTPSTSVSLQVVQIQPAAVCCTSLQCCALCTVFLSILEFILKFHWLVFEARCRPACRLCYKSYSFTFGSLTSTGKYLLHLSSHASNKKLLRCESGVSYHLMPSLHVGSNPPLLFGLSAHQPCVVIAITLFVSWCVFVFMYLLIVEGLLILCCVSPSDFFNVITCLCIYTL